MIVVIDTNVLIAANGRNTHASLRCQAACAVYLQNVKNNFNVATDTAMLVMDEYKRYCHFRGQPGVGDNFFQWFIQLKGSSRIVSRNIGSSYAAATANIPSSVAKALDRSDHKWLFIVEVGALARRG